MQRQQAIGLSTAGAGPSSSGATKLWHPCIEADLYHIVSRHAVSQQTDVKRQAILKTLQEAAHCVPEWRVIDASPWTYSYQTEESLLQVALAQVDNPSRRRSGETPSVSNRKQKKKSPIPPPESQSPDLRPLESVISGISAFLRPKGPTEDPSIGYPAPVECDIEGVQFDLLPPSPFHAPLNAILCAYRWHYERLYALIPFFDLWVRSWDVDHEVLPPPCLALLVVTYLRAEHGLEDVLQKRLQMTYDPTTANPLEDAKNVLKASKEGKLGGAKLGERLTTVPLGDVIIGFFKFFSDAKLPKRVMSIRGEPCPLREAYERLNPDSQAGPSKPPLFVQDPFLPFYNHAANLSPDIWSRLQSAAKTAVTKLESTAPLHCTFGPAVEAISTTPPEPPFLNHLIEPTIQHMIAVQAPNALVRAARQQTINTVKHVLCNRFGHKYQVECFGSTLYGVDSATSDLDMIILDPDLKRGWNPSIKSDELPAVYNMRKVGWALQDGGFERVIAITGATVPIVKFYDPRTGLNVDLNCNNTLGCWNTALLANYCNAWTPLRSMIFYIKKWAKTWALNDASGQDGPSSYSSYCLTLMIVAFLQSRGVLPNLQSCAVGQLDKNNYGFWSKLKKDKRIWSDIRYEEITEFWRRGWKGHPMSLNEALYRWFRFFAYEFKYDTHVLDIKKGGLERRQQPMLDESKVQINDKAAAQIAAQVGVGEGEPTLPNDVNDVAPVDPAEGLQPEDWRRSKLVVVDPFLVTKNCANGVSLAVNERFIQECQRAVSMLETSLSVDALLGKSLPLFPGDGKPRRAPLRELQPKKRKSSARGSALTIARAVAQSRTPATPTGYPQPTPSASGFPDPAASPISLAEFLDRMRLNHPVSAGRGASENGAGTGAAMVANVGVRRQPPSLSRSLGPTATVVPPRFAGQRVDDVRNPSPVNVPRSPSRQSAASTSEMVPPSPDRSSSHQVSQGSSTRHVRPTRSMTPPRSPHSEYIDGGHRLSPTRTRESVSLGR